MPRKALRRSHASVDRYAVFDLGREHHLSANERWMLQALCLAADFRTCAVSPAYWELSEWTGIGRDTVPKTLDALEKAGLVSPYRQQGVTGFGGAHRRYRANRGTTR